MKNELINIHWDRVSCHICDREDYHPIYLKNEPLVEGQFGYAIHPVICRRCGLIFLSPRWSKEDYSVFYTNYYDKLYRLETKTDYGTSAVINNMKEICFRIKDFINANDKLNILDVGCAYGYGLKYLKDQIPDAVLYGIEASPDGIKEMQSEQVGATLITSDFDSQWENEFEGQMDLIILRHVFEHVLDPVKTLYKLRKTLKPGGAIYFAVPDMVNIRTKLRDYKYWWEYIFRSVHTYYYSKETFLKTLEIGGLYPIIMGEEKEEIWVLASMGKKLPFTFESMYKKQKNILEELFIRSKPG